MAIDNSLHSVTAALVPDRPGLSIDGRQVRNTYTRTVPIVTSAGLSHDPT